MSDKNSKIAVAITKPMRRLEVSYVRKRHEDPKNGLHATNQSARFTHAERRLAGTSWVSYRYDRECVSDAGEINY